MNKKIGDYLFTGELKKGRRSTVYLAQSLSDPNRLFVVKNYSKRSGEIPEADLRAQLGNEMKIMDSIKHPNVTKFVEFNETKSDRPVLTEARIVISGGRGLKNGENFTTVSIILNTTCAADWQISIRFCTLSRMAFMVTAVKMANTTTCRILSSAMALMMLVGMIFTSSVIRLMGWPFVGALAASAWVCRMLRSTPMPGEKNSPKARPIQTAKAPVSR